jgi:hypothetical protein
MSRQEHMKKSERIQRAPTPYEVVRGYIQISSNVILTVSIIFLMIVPYVEVGILRLIITLYLMINLAFVLWELRKFRKNWVDWVKKK